MKHLILTFSVVIFFHINFLYGQTTGFVDTTYNTYNIDVEFSGFDGWIEGVTPLTNGRYLVVGRFLSIDGDSVGRIARLQNNGSVDPLFNFGENGFDDDVYGIKELANGLFAVWGKFTTYNNVIAQNLAIVNSNGNLIHGFNNLDTVFTGVKALAEFANGDLALAGYDSSNIYKLKRFSQQGVLDTNFQENVTFGANVSDLVIRFNDEIFVSGNFNEVNSQQQYGLAKFDSLGMLDSNFVFDFQPTPYMSLVNMRVTDLHLLQDSSVLIATNLIGSIGGTPCSSILKYDAYGMLDTNFIDFAFNAQYTRYLNQSQQGEILILHRRYDASGVEDQSYILGPIGEMVFDLSGKLLTFNQNEINRRNLNGTLDASFRQNGELLGSVTVVEPMPDGRYYVGGVFTSIDRKERFGIARMMEDGSVDPTFNFNPGLSRNVGTSIYPEYIVNDIAVQQDGKVLIAGEFDRVQEEGLEGVVRLYHNGDLDTSFNFDALNVGELKKLTVLDNGKVLLHGEVAFLSSGSVLYKDLIRLNSDGSLDSSFLFDFQAIYPGGTIVDFTVLPSGKLAVLVNNSGYNAQPSDPDLLLLNLDGSIDQNTNFSSMMTGTKDRIVNDGQGNLFVSISNVNAYSVPTYGGIDVPSLYKINSDGSLNTSFAPSIDSVQSVDDFLVMPDDKLVLMYDDSLIRLNVDGSRDTSFLGVSNKMYSNYINDIEFVKATGDIIAGGSGGFNWVYTPGIFRFETDYATDCSNRNLVVEQFSDISCSNDGSIEIKPVNYLGDIMYSWDNSPYSLNDTLFITNVAGPHTLSLYDTSGCSVNLAYIFSGSSNQYAVDDRLHLSPGSYRPGFPTTIDLVYQNDGCVPSSGEVRLVLDPLLSYGSAWVVPDQIIGDTLIWNYSSINNDSLIYSNRIFVGVSLQAQIGDFVYLSASMNGNPDVDSTNNYQVMIGPVINGYDPNDKSVYPMGECTPHYVEEGQKFTYTIRFQNTGNAEAVNIYVDDTLNAFLDPGTVRVLASSHDMYTELIGNNLLRFKFDSIMLPDSLTNPEGSKGYVVFEVDHIPQVFDETYIDNQVGIYFDFNPAVITNTVFNTIKTQSYVQAPVQMSVHDCDSIYWEGDYYGQSGVYEKTYTNVHGCDSTLVLDLSLSQSVEVKDTVEACNEYLWLETGQVYTNSGEYHAVYSTVNGCDSVLTLNLGITELNYNLEIGSDGALFPEDSLFGSTYQWLRCDSGYVVMPNQVSATYLPSIEGAYAVQISNGACSDTSECVLVDYLSIQNFELQSVELFPNPVLSYFKVNSTESITRLNLINNIGQDLCSVQLNSKEYIWNALDLAPGVYILEVITTNQVKRLKFIKE